MERDSKLIGGIATPLDLIPSDSTSGCACQALQHKNAVSPMYTNQGTSPRTMHNRYESQTGRTTANEY